MHVRRNTNYSNQAIQNQFGNNSGKKWHNKLIDIDKSKNLKYSKLNDIIGLPAAEPI